MLVISQNKDFGVDYDSATFIASDAGSIYCCTPKDKEIVKIAKYSSFEIACKMLNVLKELRDNSRPRIILPADSEINN